MVQTSQHYLKGRRYRETVIQKIGEGDIYGTYHGATDDGRGRTWDVTTTGIVLIYDEDKSLLITKIIASPNQLRKFMGGDVPEFLLEQARAHRAAGLNR